jgi:hypothetical protein
MVIMTSGACPHPWNKTKKGTFQKGQCHATIEYFTQLQYNEVN